MEIRRTTCEVISVGCETDEVLLVDVTAESTNTRRLCVESPQFELTVSRADRRHSVRLYVT